jgi:hypothetical protein
MFRPIPAENLLQSPHEIGAKAADTLDIAVSLRPP